MADQRKDGLHKLTTRLASEFGTVVAEDLNVAGMVRNRRLARHVADASFGEFRRQLEYKAAWHGARVIVADRWFASSKTCSGCGAVKAKLALPERTYVCTTCGTVLNRDVNAAVNLARLAGSAPDSNGRGADRQTGLVPQVACETSTRHRASGSDRERPNARRDCGMSIIERSVATVIRAGSGDGHAVRLPSSSPRNLRLEYAVIVT